MNRAQPDEPVIQCSGPGAKSVHNFRQDFRSLDALVATALTAVSFALHLFRVFQAGGLWRDEAATANLAYDFSLPSIISNAQHELFPALMPALLRGFSALAGTDDSALRVFGMFVGLGILASLWVSMRLAQKSAPVLSMGLLGFNGGFIVWGDAIRGYGIGVLLMVLTIGMVWRLTQRLSGWEIGATGCD